MGDKPCLFNLIEDPCEYLDLSEMEEYAVLVAYMSAMLKLWYDNAQQLPLPEYYENAIDPRADPKNFANGFWQPWMRDYADAKQGDAYDDFEDVMAEYALNNGLVDDISQSDGF